MSKRIENIEQYNEAKRKIDAYSEAVMNYCKQNKTNGIPVAITQTFPFADEVDNDLRSAVEVYYFLNNLPEKYTVYINEKKRIATTWTGDMIGSVSFGSEYRSNFGDKRMPVRIHTTNGHTYSGTYYKSNSDLAHIKKLKR